MMKDRIAKLDLSQRHQFDVERRFWVTGTDDRLAMYNEMSIALDDTLFSIRTAVVHVPRSDNGNMKLFGFDGQIKYFYGKLPLNGESYECRAVASITVIRER